jgi:Tfp pilus assembly protein PilF
MRLVSLRARGLPWSRASGRGAPRSFARVFRSITPALLLLTTAACATSRAPHQRDLESLALVDGKVVRATRPSSTAYAHYVEAKLAMEREPADLERAKTEIEDAISYDPVDPGLWCLSAEIAIRRGDDAARQEAMSALALLAPGWTCPPADDQSQLAR